MASLRGCPYCKNGWMRWDAYSCDECNGENSRRSYKERTGNLATCMHAAATEEMRVRMAVERVRDMWSLV